MDIRNKSSLSLIFSDIQFDIDALTGFFAWKSFVGFLKKNSGIFPIPVLIAVCDINGLTAYNFENGREDGDGLIKRLSELFVEYMPQNSYFVRAQEASLICITCEMDIADMRKRMAKLKFDFESSLQYSVVQTSEDMPSVADGIDMAIRAMKSRKMLDKDSAHSATLEALVKALQECDGDTEAHVRRTQRLGELIGDRLGLTDEDQSNLSLLCILHDIGKIAVPLEILNKPAKLTDNEFAVIKQHVEKGYQIAVSSREFAPLADMIRHHHERWDGKGYPDGISGDDIPLLARIIPVVDAFDVMVSDRVYKKRMSVEDAKEELKSCAATQFDPKIVEEFLGMLDDTDISDIMQKPANNYEDCDSDSISLLSRDEVDSELLKHNVTPIAFSRYLLDGHLNILSIDDKFTELTGYTKEDVKKLKLNQVNLIPEEDVTEYLVNIGEQMLLSDVGYLEHRIKRKDGELIYVYCMGRNFYDSIAKSDRADIIIFAPRETTTFLRFMKKEHDRAQIRLMHWEDALRRDPLTGLRTYSAFMEDIGQKLQEDEGKLVFISMDIDGFGEYNELFGHKEGDELLIRASKILSGTLRDGDFACRVGSDKFAAAFLCSLEYSNAHIAERLKQIYNKVDKALSKDGVKVVCSMGACVSCNENDSFDVLYETANEACARAKKEGGGRIVIM